MTSNAIRGIRRKKSSLSEVKIAVLGGPGVGKSALIVRFLTKRYIGEYDHQAEHGRAALVRGHRVGRRLPARVLHHGPPELQLGQAGAPPHRRAQGAGRPKRRYDPHAHAAGAIRGWRRRLAHELGSAHGAPRKQSRHGPSAAGFDRGRRDPGQGPGVLLQRGGGVRAGAPGGQRLPRALPGGAERAQAQQDVAAGPRAGRQGHAHLRARQERLRAAEGLTIEAHVVGNFRTLPLLTKGATPRGVGRPTSSRAASPQAEDETGRGSTGGTCHEDDRMCQVCHDKRAMVVICHLRL
ncbi:uncharacterized protein [Penaeus vannamei]|uniref:uncharacterized protein isoform X1 n=1 Tax=Penaeus vannamei TaxID=6689 RepID=UPI00387F4331